MSSPAAAIADRYEVQPVAVGCGAYGTVYLATSKADGQKVAVKVFNGAFQYKDDAHKLYREVSILLRINHPSVVSLLDVLLPDDCVDAFLVFEVAEMDLAKYRRLSDKLSDLQLASLTFQLFQGLEYLHCSNVVHRDLKPENILVYEKGALLKIADFGLARDLPTEGDDSSMTVQVITIWYRPPELLLGCGQYGSEVDIWSAGCIVAMLALGAAPIRGRDEGAMLHNTIVFLGAPSEAELASLPQKENANDWVKEVLRFGVNPKGTLEAQLATEPAIQQLLRKILRYDPGLRPSASQVLEDPYFGKFHRTRRRPAQVTLLSGLHDAAFYREELRRQSAALLPRTASSPPLSVPSQGTSPKQLTALPSPPMSPPALKSAKLPKIGPLMLLQDVGLELSVHSGGLYTVTGPPAIITEFGDQVFGSVSNIVPVNLLLTARRQIGIPDAATHFCFAYPAVVERWPHGSSTNEAPDPRHSFLRYGGFLYFDNPDSRVPLQQNAIAEGYGLNFSGPFALPENVRVHLHACSRMQPVTMPALQARGCKSFGWLNPDENRELTLKHGLPFGGFAYDLGDPNDNCYFAIE